MGEGRLNLLRDGEFLTSSQAESILADCQEWKALLTAILKKTKSADA